MADGYTNQVGAVGEADTLGEPERTIKRTRKRTGAGIDPANFGSGDIGTGTEAEQPTPASGPKISVEDSEPGPGAASGNMGMLGALFGALGSMPGASPTGGKKTGKSKAAQDNAEYYVTIADMMVMGMVGYEAQIAPHERHLIVSGLADMLQNDDRIAKLGQYMNPIALVAGIGLWAARCTAIYFTKHPRKPKAQAPQYTPAKVEPGAPGPVPASAPIPESNTVFSDDTLFDVMARR